MKGSSRILDRTSGLLALFLRLEVEDEIERDRNEEESRQPAQETDEDGTNAVERPEKGRWLAPGRPARSVDEPVAVAGMGAVWRWSGGARLLEQRAVETANRRTTTVRSMQQAELVLD